MAVQFIPIIAAVAPYLAQIAAATLPAFTAKTPEVVKTDPVIAKQIDELQSAATHNAESIQVLAEKLQVAVAGIEAAALEARTEIATYKRWLAIAVALASASLLLSVTLLVLISR